MPHSIGTIYGPFLPSSSASAVPTDGYVLKVLGYTRLGLMPGTTASLPIEAEILPRIAPDNVLSENSVCHGRFLGSFRLECQNAKVLYGPRLYSCDLRHGSAPDQQAV